MDRARRVPASEVNEIIKLWIGQFETLVKGSDFLPVSTLSVFRFQNSSETLNASSMFHFNTDICVCNYITQALMNELM